MSGVSLGQAMSTVNSIGGVIGAAAFLLVAGLLSMALGLFILERSMPGPRPVMRKGFAAGCRDSLLLTTQLLVGASARIPSGTLSRPVATCCTLGASVLKIVVTAIVTVSLQAAASSMAVSSFSDLSGKTMLMPEATTGEIYVNRNGVGITMIPAENIDSALVRFAAGESEAMLYDQPILSAFIGRDAVTNGAKRFALVGEILERQQYGIALTPGLDNLRKSLDKAILAVYGTTEVAELRARWLYTEEANAAAKTTNEVSASSSMMDFITDNVQPVSIVVGSIVGVAFVVGVLAFVWRSSWTLHKQRNLSCRTLGSWLLDSCLGQTSQGSAIQRQRTSGLGNYSTGDKSTSAMVRCWRQSKQRLRDCCSGRAPQAAASGEATLDDPAHAQPTPSENFVQDPSAAPLRRPPSHRVMLRDAIGALTTSDRGTDAATARIIAGTEARVSRQAALLRSMGSGDTAPGAAWAEPAASADLDDKLLRGDTNSDGDELKAPASKHRASASSPARTEHVQQLPGAAASTPNSQAPTADVAFGGMAFGPDGGSKGAGTPLSAGRGGPLFDVVAKAVTETPTARSTRNSKTSEGMPGLAAIGTADDAADCGGGGCHTGALETHPAFGVTARERLFFKREQWAMRAEGKLAPVLSPNDLLWEVWQRVDMLAQQALLQRAMGRLDVPADLEDVPPELVEEESRLLAGELVTQGMDPQLAKRAAMVAAMAGVHEHEGDSSDDEDSVGDFGGADGGGGIASSAVSWGALKGAPSQLDDEPSKLAVPGASLGAPQSQEDVGALVPFAKGRGGALPAELGPQVAAADTTKTAAATLDAAARPRRSSRTGRAETRSRQRSRSRSTDVTSSRRWMLHQQSGSGEFLASSDRHERRPPPRASAGHADIAPLIQGAVSPRGRRHSRPGV